MSVFRPTRWTAKPPPGTQLASGLWAPDLIANAYNENYAGAVVYNYARGNVAGAAAFPKSASITTPSNAAFAAGRFGSRLGITNTSGNLTYTNGGALTPTAAVTVMCGFRKRDATLRSAGAFGTNSGSRIGAHVPFSDGIVYWDWLSSGTGQRISVSGLTFGDDVWAFTMGPTRGQEIWQNGQIKQTGTYGGARTADAVDFVIGNHNGTAADLVDWDFFYMWSYQLPQSVIQALTVRPFSVFEQHRTRFFPSLAIPGNVTAVAATATALLVPPVVTAAATIQAVAMTATALLVAPVVTAAATVLAVAMTASAAMIAPTIGLGADVLAVPMTSTAQMIAPVVTGAATIQAIAATAQAAMRVPTVVGATGALPVIFRLGSTSGQPGSIRPATLSGKPGSIRPAVQTGTPGALRPSTQSGTPGALRTSPPSGAPEIFKPKP